jgi:hypothetical protein
MRSSLIVTTLKLVDIGDSATQKSLLYWIIMNLVPYLRWAPSIRPRPLELPNLVTMAHVLASSG